MRSLYLAVTLLLAGCSMPIEPEPSGIADVSDGPPEKLRWIGQTDSELVKEMGAPKTMIDATLLGGPASVVYVYLDPEGCFDSYVVVVETGEIIKYFCR
jgi:PBP1b-binding outer membrane lipoprotein LpoB